MNKESCFMKSSNASSNIVHALLLGRFLSLVSFRKKVLQFADIPVTCYVVDFSSICNMFDSASIEYYLIINAFSPQSFIYEKPDTHLRTLSNQKKRFPPQNYTHSFQISL